MHKIRILYFGTEQDKEKMKEFGKQHGVDVEFVSPDEKVSLLTGEIGEIDSGLTVIFDEYWPEPEPCQGGEADWKEPLPRPAKGKPLLKQAPRQSFRKIMRSVNRNR